MKYSLIALAAVTLWTGSASAGQDVSKWHCVQLKANWMNAPQSQCPVAFIDDRIKPQAPAHVREHAPPETVDEIPK
jgi:hypothetical protein